MPEEEEDEWQEGESSGEGQSTPAGDAGRVEEGEVGQQRGQGEEQGEDGEASESSDLPQPNEADLSEDDLKILKANRQYALHLNGQVFREWVLYTAKCLKIRENQWLIRRKKQHKCFIFWHQWAEKIAQQRYREWEVRNTEHMARQRRFYHKWKLYVKRSLHIKRALYHMNPSTHLTIEGFAKLRRATRHFRIRRRYEHWYDVVIFQLKVEASAAMYRRNYLSRHFRGWKAMHDIQRQKIMQAADARVRQRRLFESLEQAEADAKALAEAEAKAEELRRQREKEKRQKEKQDAIMWVRRRKEAEAAARTRLILKVQHDERRRRVEAEMAQLEQDFCDKWDVRTEEMMEGAKERILEWLHDLESRSAIQAEFMRLKQEFYQPPGPDNQDREFALRSPKNLTFVYIETKLFQQGKLLEEAIEEFDEDGNGYLSHAEFKNMMEHIGVPLREGQVLEVIATIDDDNDGFIDMDELQEAMSDLHYNGVRGSPWKLYTDPAQDVLCYHNFLTDEKFLEHELKDAILLRITRDNYIGDAAYKQRERIRKARKEDWEFTLQSHMAKRMQRMFHVWKGRTLLSTQRWKVYREVLKEQRGHMKCVVRFVESSYRGAATRVRFRKQLHNTLEKRYDPNSSRLFYYNHHTKESVWEMPLLLRKYGDVEMPSVWVRVETDSSGRFPPHYYHAREHKRRFQKPDGIPLCEVCNTELCTRVCPPDNDGCGMNFCFGCYRKWHAHPDGFNVMRTRPNEYLRTHREYHNQLVYFKHSWYEFMPFQCGMCKQRIATFDCQGCKMKICRPCFKRIHLVGNETMEHDYLVI